MARKSSDINKELSDLDLANVDLSTLSDDELNKALGLIQERTSTPYDLDSEDIGRVLDQKFKGYGVQGDVAALAKPAIINAIMQSGGLPDAQTLNNILTRDVYTRPSGHRADDSSSLLGRIAGGGAGYLTDPLGIGVASGQDVGRKLTTSEGGMRSFNQIAGGIDPLKNMIGDQDFINSISDVIKNQKTKGIYSTSSSAPDYSSQLKAIQGLLGGRADETKKNTAVADYLGNLQGELSKGTEDFIAAQRTAASNRLSSDILPNVAQNLNARGLLFGGDLPAGVNEAVANEIGGVESQYADLLTQDLSFFQNAAYQDQLKKSLVSGQDYASQLQAEEAAQLQGQEQRFNASESALTSMSKLDQARRQAELQLQQQKNRLDAQRALEDKQYQANLYGGLAKAGGAAAGAAVGGPAGAVVGSSVGSSVFNFSKGG